MIYLGIVTFLIVLNIFLHPINSNLKRKTFLRISFLLLALVAGVRNNTVGIDTFQYYKNFKVISNLSFLEFGSMRYEYGFSLVCKLLSYISSNPQILILVTSIFTNFCVMRFLYLNSKNVAFSVYTYILLNYYFSYMNIMRQAIAIAIILLFFEYLKKDEKAKFIIGVILASLFHFSAIVCLSFLFLEKIKYKKSYKYIIVPVFLILFIFGRDLFLVIAQNSERFSIYIGSEFDVSNYFGALINFVVSILILFFGIYINRFDKESIEKNENNKEWMLYFKLMICYAAFTLLEMRVSIFNRITPYFSVYTLIWIPNNLLKIKKAKDRFFTSFLIFVFLLLYCLIIMIYRPNWYGVVPYQIFK